jgi:hypothetical protein
VSEVQTYGETLQVLVDSAQRRLPEIERALKQAGLTHRGARLVPARMEQAFLSLIRQMEA